MENFGMLIHKLRVANNLTLLELADRLGMDLTTLSKIENNKRTFQPELLPKLAKEFNLSLEDLELEYLSGKVAEMVFDKPNSSEVLSLAKRKVRLIKENKKLSFDI